MLASPCVRAATLHLRVSRPLPTTRDRMTIVAMIGRWEPARFRLRHDRTSRMFGVVLLVFVIAMTTGIALAATAGARRSDSAYPRFLRWAHDPEINFSCALCTERQLDAEFDRIRAAPFVLDTARGGFAEVVVDLESGARPSFLAFLPVVDLDRRLGYDLPRAKVLHGRLANPDAPDEVSVSFVTAER